MNYTNRIITDPNIMLGKPVVKGTRITVEIILKKLSTGMSIEDITIAYPHLTTDDILAAISYSAEVISNEELIAI